MSTSKRIFRTLGLTLIMAALLLSTACSRIGATIDPGDWGYDSVVTYDALGGIINSRGVRETYYMDNSYVFEPAGTTNMLIQPVKDGYVLAAWYTAKEDIVDEDGSVIGYSFKAEDRWDFDEDRVQGDMTLYARWVEQASVDYVDADTGDIVFSKNLTEDSPIQPLSGAAEQLIVKDGYTLFDYYADDTGTVLYDFSSYVHADVVPTNRELFAQLQQEFPDYIVDYDYQAPVEQPDEEEAEQADPEPDLYINKLGYDITTEDPEIRAAIRARKDEIIHESIGYYIENTADKVVYLKYIEGNYLRVTDREQFKQGSSYTLTGGADGLILLADIDFSDVALDPADVLSGAIYGNGHTISNLSMTVTSRKADMSDEKQAGLFTQLKDAEISDLTIENLEININVRSGTHVTVGALAVEAENSRLRDVHFNGLTINSGRGDDGEADYVLHDLIVADTGYELINVTGENITVNASEFAEINRYFADADADNPEDESTEGTDTDETP